MARSAHKGSQKKSTLNFFEGQHVFPKIRRSDERCIFQMGPNEDISIIIELSMAG